MQFVIKISRQSEYVLKVHILNMRKETIPCDIAFGAWQTLIDHLKLLEEGKKLYIEQKENDFEDFGRILLKKKRTQV